MTQFSPDPNSQSALDTNGSSDRYISLPTTLRPGDRRQRISAGDRPTMNQPKLASDANLPSKQPLSYQPDSIPLKRRKSSIQQRFLDLPIRSKQFIALFTSEVISVIGLVGVGAILIVAGGRSQLVQQAKSELVVTGINYNIKINQMGFGFRGQADNAAIIAAANAVATKEPLSSDLMVQVRKILQNEVKARNIEFATLVDKNAKIIVNANANREGERFDPNNLVSRVLKEPQQIKSSEIVSWSEVAKESPPLPKEFSGQDALVRYTVTPVKNPTTETVIGALVSGDIVNRKMPIVSNTVEAFGGGYSAVYLRQPTGTFTLATALDQGQAPNLEQAKPNVALPDNALLEDAVKADGQPVTKRVQMGGQTYTMAARALKNSAGQPIAVLLRGTPEKSLNALIKDNLLLQLVVTILAIAVNVLLAILLGRAISKPIKDLQQTTQQFSEGDFQARAEVVSADEVGQLAIAFNTMADRIETSMDEIRRKEILLAETAQQARQEAEAASWEAESLAQEQRQQKEELQKRALELLQEIAPISQGDLTIAAKVTDDEIGTIADSYNTTVESLRKIVVQVQAAVNQVTEATNQNDTYIQELSTEASRQVAEIAIALDRVKEMTEVAQAVAMNAEQAKVVVQQATQTVEAGDAAMDRTVDGIRAIRVTVAETAKKVKHLGESSQKISTVVELISNFAEQTKMLALNASIEAALAGEEGRGFAVVADEVRALARQSAEATEEIRKLVASIQAETNEVVAAMESGTEQVVSGTKLVDETRQSLNKITIASSQISQLVGAIAQATIVQSQASDAVTQTMQDIAAIANKTSTETSQFSSSYEQLRKVAQTLQAEVGQFKVS
ncbi:methyl-accepting chemotaxis protein [Kovacikia minuta]|uniref:methyl-accepting chemotaxis protein n=1 Tax=Kovacikia minuta TaxID=2931930 RepID=UPI001CED3844|nr:methyl-accepting chemotaxis protein [Kovacikia minuta]